MASRAESFLPNNFSCTNMVVGQVRATAIDLLRGTGLDTEAARLKVRPPDEPASIQEEQKEEEED